MTTPRLLSNRYELGETLGYGGMSEVHRGRDVRLGRDVAIKVLRADLARDPTFQERFRREAQNAAALNHPAIVAVYDTGETQTEYGPLPYIVMEYVDGRTLRDIVKSEGPLPGKRAMEIMADVCAALDFSHRHGIVHRDVKPANVMITRTGAVKVMDFGIARAVGDGQAAVTQTAAVIGTAQYLSPEQARGESVDARSDVYAAGCVVFELLTGEPPFTGDSPVAVAYQHVREDPKPPSSLNPRVNPALDAIVLKAMAKNPANRYQSAAEMRVDLVRVLSGQRPAAPAVMTEDMRTSVMNAGRTTQVVGGGRHRPEKLEEDYYDDGDYDPEIDARRNRRRRNWIIAAIVLVVVLLIVGIAWLMSNSSGNNNSNNGMVTVPNLVGQQQSAALSELAAKNLKQNTVPVVCSANGASTPSTAASGVTCPSTDYINKVISTNPTAGASVQPGAPVTLYVGVAAQAVPVPDLTGLSEADAQAKLASVGLTLSPQVSQQVTQDTTKFGKVITQQPQAGVTVPASTAITITVGAQPQKTTMPDVTGEDQNTAKATLTAAPNNFQVSVKNIDSTQPGGTVVRTSPSAGNTVYQGQAVTMYVSNGSQTPFSMPQLIGMSKSQAQSTLQGQYGWTGSFNVTYVSTYDPSKNGMISDQNPEPGQSATKNQTIGLYIYQYGGGGSGGGSTTTTTTTSPPFGF